MANGNGFIILMFGAMVLGVAGLYFITKKKGPTASDFELEVTKDETGRIQVGGTNLDLGGISFSSTNPIYSTTFLENKPGVPIISGRSPYHRIPSGTCKCNDLTCCYESIYQPERGGPIDRRSCSEIFYGDPVDACERAVQQYDNEIYQSQSSWPRRYHSGRASKINLARRR